MTGENAVHHPSPPRPRSTILLLALLGAALLAAAVPAGSATVASTPTWAPISEATIRPGVQTITAGGQCTANFVFYDAVDIYLGQAAHCASTGGVAPDGCTATTVPVGTEVQVQGASQPGTLAYSSWDTMQDTAVAEDAETCMFNDLALVRLDPEDHGKINPTLPWWGGPVGVGAPPALLESVYSYGNSSLRQGLEALNPRQGIALATSPGGWDTAVLNVTPALPGDSGSAVLGADGNAVGVLTTLQVLPLAGSNGVISLTKALEYLEANTAMDVTLATGTAPFTPGLPLLGVLLPPG